MLFEMTSTLLEIVLFDKRIFPHPGKRKDQIKWVTTAEIANNVLRTQYQFSTTLQ